MNDWIWAGITLAAGLIVAAVAGRVVRNLLARPSRPEMVQQAAAPVGSLVFSIGLVAALMAALGFVNKPALEDIPDDLVAAIPDIMAALIVVILGHVAATLAAAALEQGLSRATGQAQRQVPVLARAVIMAFAIILAAAQLGIDTTIINISVAAILFSIGLAAALMIGLGSRQVSAEVAAGRALRRILHAGDRLTADDVSGEVLQVRSVAVELRLDDGTFVLIPNSKLLDGLITLERRPIAGPSGD